MKPWQVMKAHEEGAEIEQYDGLDWEVVTKPYWAWDETDYRVKDEYRDLKLAHSKGQIIEWDDGAGGWSDIKDIERLTIFLPNRLESKTPTVN